MQKLQFDTDTLATLLGTGRIYQMGIANVDGEEVLRIACEENAGEYKIVKASKKPVQKQAKTPKEPKPKPLNFGREVHDPDTSFGSKAVKFGEKLGKGVVDWIRTPPRKRPDEW